MPMPGPMTPRAARPAPMFSMNGVPSPVGGPGRARCLADGERLLRRGRMGGGVAKGLHGLVCRLAFLVVVALDGRDREHQGECAEDERLHEGEHDLEPVERDREHRQCKRGDHAQSDLAAVDVAEESHRERQRLDELQHQLEAAQRLIVGETSARNQRYFEAEMEKLDAWAEDLKDDLEREIKETDKEIKALKRDARQESALEPKLELHRRVKDLERRRNEKRRSLFEAQDEVDSKKETLISQVEARMSQRCAQRELFALRWKVV